MTKQQIFEIVSNCILRGIDEGEGKIRHLPSEIDLNTPLFGKDSRLDSLGLATVALDVEEAVSIAIGENIDLLTDEVVHRKPSPFRTVGAFCDYIAEVVNA